MARPEEYGIDVNSLVDALAETEGISIETPHRVTPGTAKALARRAVIAALEQIPGTQNSNLQPGTLRRIDGTDPFSRIQQGIKERIDSGELTDTMPDLVGPAMPEARIRSSQYEEEGTVA